MKKWMITHARVQVVFVAGILMMLAWRPVMAQTPPSARVSATQAKRVQVETKISSVTVFMSGAELKRTGNASIPAGRSELVMAGVSTDIEQQSVQVGLEGDLTILSVGVRKNFLNEEEVKEDIKALNKQMEGIDEKLGRQKKSLEIYRQEEAMLVRNQELKTGNLALKPADLKAALDFQKSRLEETYARQLEIEKSMKELELEKTKIRLHLGELNDRKNLSVNEIYALVEADKPVQSRVEASYLVNKAGWFPTYNVSVKDISSPMQMQFNANVFQSSGEVWKEVKISLSSGNPRENNARPELEPWYLRYVDRSISYSQLPSFTGGNMIMGRVVDEKGVPVSNASIQVKGTSQGVVTDANGVYRLNNAAPGAVLVASFIGYQSKEFAALKGFTTVELLESSGNLQEVVVAGYGLSGRVAGVAVEDDRKQRKVTLNTTTKPIGVSTVYQPISTRYDIKEIYTISNDGKVNMIDIKRISINADYEYYTAPKLDPSAYLTARILDWQSLDLLAGEVNLFFEGTFLGKSFIDPATAGDTMSLSLGKDKGVVVKRTMVKDFSSRRFIGANKTETRDFEISIRNNKTQAVKIIVEDQFPISTMKEIEVDRREHDGGRLNEETQVVTWEVNIVPKEEKKHRIKYTVKYPKDKILQLD
ncbi:mucoidy inhibitor MuiA family protein [Flavihumibacter stibioxidans]|uniref:Mucoidy inhibitor MuiA family protein n=1 Tax=Flavihumibacter stibioxidans TaxID=1834163 RepID=A0ABR7M6W1_9BACT|nr:DUF4139 domain-containing protein [Flavihumibacter stibioxidans]MBC6490753.1 hypothetical protein [Flavihumibacter stibioxidans]